MENTIGTDPVDIVRPMRDYIRPKIVECHLEKVSNYRRKWLPSGGGFKKKYQKQISKNNSECINITRTYCRFNRGFFLYSG